MSFGYGTWLIISGKRERERDEERLSSMRFALLSKLSNYSFKTL